jgi:hypothetical protein
MWLVILAVAVTNWPWIKGYLLFSHYADIGEFYTPGGSAHFVPRGGILAPFEVYVPSPKFVSLIPPVFGVAGLISWWRERRTGMLLIFLPQILFLFVVAFYGVFFGLNAVAPARITLPLALYLFFPAAHGLTVGATRVDVWFRRLFPARRAELFNLGTIAVLASAAIYGGLPTSVWRPYTLPMLEAREGFTKDGVGLIKWLAEHTDRSGRILHEETDRRSHQYYGTHMPSLIPYYTGVEFAGGPAPHALLKHNFLRFIAGTFRGRPIQQVQDGTLSAYFSLYNVRWVLCWKDSTKHRLDRVAFLTQIGDYEKFSLYEVEIPPSYFLRGSGRLEVHGSRILLHDLIPEEGVVAIKYHWLESLRTDPPRTIEPLPMLDDPVPFLSIADPPRDLVIFNDSDFGLRDRRN